MSTSLTIEVKDCSNIEVPVPQYRWFTIHRETNTQGQVSYDEKSKIHIKDHSLFQQESGFKLNKSTFHKLKLRMLKAKRNKRLMMLSKATTSVASKKNLSPPNEGFYCLKEPRRKETCSQIDFKMEEEKPTEVPINRKRIQKILSIFDQRILKTKKLVDLRKQKGCCRMFELLEKKNHNLKAQEMNVVTSLNKTIKKLKDRVKEVSELEF